MAPDTAEKVGKATPPTFQDVIMNLQRYWASTGCVVLQPYDNEVGAGTNAPATTLRSLGPDTWRTCYVQGCRRPTDGRYGENPNRGQFYYQFQVLVKPSPDNIQDLYLGSLEAIGIDISAHDVRFVEDDWESPTLGAWGLGWEIWIDVKGKVLSARLLSTLKLLAVRISHARYSFAAEMIFWMSFSHGSAFETAMMPKIFLQLSNAASMSHSSSLGST